MSEKLPTRVKRAKNPGADVGRLQPFGAGIADRTRARRLSRRSRRRQSAVSGAILQILPKASPRAALRAGSDRISRSHRGIAERRPLSASRPASTAPAASKPWPSRATRKSLPSPWYLTNVSTVISVARPRARRGAREASRPTPKWSPGSSAPCARGTPASGPTACSCCAIRAGCRRPHGAAQCGRRAGRDQRQRAALLCPGSSRGRARARAGGEHRNRRRRAQGGARAPTVPGWRRCRSRWAV